MKRLLLLIAPITILTAGLLVGIAWSQEDESWHFDQWVSGGNWVSWAMMGMEKPEPPAEEQIEDKLHEIERLVKEIRKLNQATPREPERLAP
jgi:hypothetical protein